MLRLQAPELAGARVRLALGARLEGVLRCAQPSSAAGEHGLLRDTAVLSVLAEEWPDVRRRLVGAGSSSAD